MNLMHHETETHRESFLYFSPKVSNQQWKGLSRQITIRRRLLENLNKILHVWYLWIYLLRIFWSEKHSTTLDWFLQHSDNIFFPILLACFDDLLICLSGFLKHLGRTDMALNHLRQTGLKLKVQNWCFIQ